MNKKIIITSAVFTLIFRLIFASILMLAAIEGDTQFLKGLLVVIVSIMVTYGLYRFVKMIGFANRLEKMNNVFDNKN